MHKKRIKPQSAHPSRRRPKTGSKVKSKSIAGLSIKDEKNIDDESIQNDIVIYDDVSVLSSSNIGAIDVGNIDLQDFKD